MKKLGGHLWAAIATDIAAAFGLMVSLPGQATHMVGPGGHAEIRDAIAVAAAGDLILVQPPSTPAYLPFTATVGVTIRGVGGDVFIENITATVPPGQALHLVNLKPTGLVLTGGRCTVENCLLANGLSAQSAELVIVASTIGTGSNPWADLGGLSATNSMVTAIDSSFTGRSSSPFFPSGSSTAGIALTNSEFYGSRLTANGGTADGGIYASGGHHALMATASTVWMSDSTLIGGTTSNPFYLQQCPVSAQQGRLARCTLTPLCSSAIPTSGPLLGVHQVAPIQSPGAFTLQFQTRPNGFVWVFASPSLARSSLPFLEQPILLETTAMFEVGLLAADSLGRAVGTWSVPPAMTNQSLWLQAAGDSAPWQVSPIAGGVVR